MAVTLCVLLALIAAACSGGDGAEEAPTPGADGASDGATGGDGAITVDASLELVDPTGDSLFPCAAGPGAQATVAYLQVDDGSTNAERMRAVLGDYNRRCGANLLVEPHVQGSIPDADACDAVVASSPAVTVADAPTLTAAACFADADALLWSEVGLPTVAFADSDDRLITTEAPADVVARTQVLLLDAEGLLADQVVTVVHIDTAEATAIATDGFVAALADAGIEASTAAISGSCDVSGAEAAWEATMVITVVPTDCQLALAEAGLAAGSNARWVVFDLRSSIADDHGEDFGSVSRSFDVALAYSASPAVGSGWARALDPHARDAACNTYLDSLLGTTTTYPSLAWHEGARLCSTANALLQVLSAAGPDPDADAIFGALQSANVVPFPRGQVGGFGPDRAWVAPAQLFALEWSADCACWTTVAGPLAAA